ncbi:MAG TPA: hypothetical protein VFK05_28230 [Polyangiaceae bacterium]|nr:hypothetical protein [Polyangiaceae bacterium]
MARRALTRHARADFVLAWSMLLACAVQIGPHRLDEPEPGLLLLRCAGDLLPREAEALMALLLAAKVHHFVIDISHLGQISSQAREALVAAFPCGEHALAVVGGSFRARLVVTSLLAARNSLPAAVFFDCLEEAVAWGRSAG